MTYNSANVYRWTGLAIFLVTLGIYVKTMAPTVAFWDCGEFIATAYTMSIPHPPGSPLYVLLGRIFSLVPIGEVALRINFMSALSSALAIWCVYLTTAALGRRALGGHPLRPFDDTRDIGVIAGAAVAALTLAFSYTQWYNASEAEVYGYSILFTCLGLWLIVYWEGTGHGQQNDRWLFAIAYLFGLGGGLHLLCLLTIPSLLVLAWFSDDDPLQKLIKYLVGLGIVGFVAILALGPGTPSNAVMVLGLLGLLYYLRGKDQRLFYLLLGVVVLFAIGYSTYAALYIRSGLNPVIDENDPETWRAFLAFLNREQYGTDSMLTTMLNARAERMYQFWDQQMKYFFQQFPFPLLEHSVTFRKATGPEPHVIAISLVPYALGLWGLYWHARRDWQRFLSIFAMFLIMGFGLSLYLNMPDPQPRERHYVFGGMYLAYALWIGLGWTALVEASREKLARLHALTVVAAALFGLLLPVGVCAKLYHIEDRSGDYIAYDYAYNLLQSCEPDGILFTNGDNDTFPLWFLQEVEGIRKDVRVVNLSLLNTSWYIKQLRDREPKIDIRYDDQFIDEVLTDFEDEDLYRRYWPEPKTVAVAGMEFEVRDYAGYNVLRIQDEMVLKIIGWNNWKKPIHFALTVPVSNRSGVDPYLAMAGMVVTLRPDENPPVAEERIETLIYDTFQLRSLLDPEVYKDENTARLLGNYRAIYAQLAGHYEAENKVADLEHLAAWGMAHLPLNWHTVYLTAQRFERLERLELAAVHMEKAGRMLLAARDTDPNANYENLVTVADLVHDRYRDPGRAAGLYRAAIALDGENPDAYYGLAASLQALDRTEEGLQLIDDYIARHGEVEKMVYAREILRNALGLSEN